MGKVIILSGPGGTGKNTLLKMLLDRNPGLQKIVTATSREMREGEIEGFDHIFLDRGEFEKRINNGDFIEYNLFHNNYYGTLKDTLDAVPDQIAEIDYHGALAVKKYRSDAILIFITPPSIDELANRMRSRHDTEEHVQARVKIAEEEMAMQSQFDHIVVNPTGHPEKAVEEIEKIIKNA